MTSNTKRQQLGFLASDSVHQGKLTLNSTRVISNLHTSHGLVPDNALIELPEPVLVTTKAALTNSSVRCITEE